MTEVGIDHPMICKDLIRLACCNDLARIEDHDVVG